MSLQARERWSEVVLAPRLRETVTRLNPTLSPAETDAVVAKVAGYGHQSLVEQMAMRTRSNPDINPDTGSMLGMGGVSASRSVPASSRTPRKQH